MSKPKISIIIPFYNTGEYLNDCLQSVIKADLFLQCEVILINDGSFDNSIAIAQNVVDKYDNIFLCHQGNMGLSVARNRGIDLAKGKYIFFLDSDDLVNPEYISKLYDYAEKMECEAVYAGFSWMDERKNNAEPAYRTVLNQSNPEKGLDFLAQRMKMGDWHNEVCCALYRTDFLKMNNLKFDQSLSLYEDILFTTEVLLCANKIGIVENYGYLYRVRAGSLVHDGPRERDIIAAVKILDTFCALYLTLGAKKRCVLGEVLFEHISMILYYIGEVNPPNRNAYFVKLHDADVMKILRKSIRTPKNGIKYIIFRFAMPLYYHLVKKKEMSKNVYQ